MQEQSDDDGSDDHSRSWGRGLGLETCGEKREASCHAIGATVEAAGGPGTNYDLHARVWLTHLST